MFNFVVLLLLFCSKAYSTDLPDRIVELKRKTSNVLNLRGIQFDSDIEELQFDGLSWGIVDLNDDMVDIMDAILDDEIYKMSQSGYGQDVDTTSNFVIPVARMIGTSSYPSYIYYSTKGIEDKQIKSLIKDIASDLIYCEGVQYSLLVEEEDKNDDDDENKDESSVIIFKELSDISLNNAELGMQSDNSSVIHISNEISNRTLKSLLLTALGFTNPLWNKDRDKYVTINWQNIKDKHKYLFYQWNTDFVKHPTGPSPQVLYNFKSPLHYLPTEFAKDTKDFTWTPKDAEEFDELENLNIDSLMAAFQYCSQPYDISQFAPPLVPPCEDSDIKCLSWKDQNCCRQYDVAKKCPRACKTCVMSDPEKCIDVNTFCPDWATVYCDRTSKNSDYMKSTCPLSCGCPDFQNDNSQLNGTLVGGSWKLVGESKTVCNHPQQQTLVSKESACKHWCSSKKLNFCFWDISENDGFCFGTIDCQEHKESATPYRRFDLVS